MNKSILVSAYGCEPLKGSEPGVGWNWVLQLAQQNKLYVITRANNKAAIEEYLPTSIRHNITFYYYDTPLFLRQFKNKAKGLYFYYFFWQIGIVSIAKKIIRNNHVDYTMHLTFWKYVDAHILAVFVAFFYLGAHWWWRWRTSFIFEIVIATSEIHSEFSVCNE